MNFGVKITNFAFQLSEWRCYVGGWIDGLRAEEMTKLEIKFGSYDI